MPGFPQSDHTVGKPSADADSLCSERSASHLFGLQGLQQTPASSTNMKNYNYILSEQIGWYRLWGRNILMARRSTFLESRFWRSHVCGTLSMPLLGNVYFLCNKILLDIKAKSTENMTVQQAFSFWPSQLLHDFFFLFWAIVQCNQIFFSPHETTWRK